jgi:hypothetical protein
MIKLGSRIILPLLLSGLLFPLCLESQACQAIATYLPTCSYTALNGSCNIVIDRLNAATPPTIYMRRNTVLKLHIVDLSAFESLSLDANYPTTTVPPDAFAAGMTALSATFGKLTVVEPQFGKVATTNFVPPVSEDEAIKAVKGISEKQKALGAALDGKDPLSLAQDSLKVISTALQTPPADVCMQGRNIPANNPWLNLEQWRKEANAGLDIALKTPTNAEIKAYDARLKALDIEINTLATSDAFESFGGQDMLNKLRANQTALQNRVDAFLQVNQKLQALSKAVANVNTPKPTAEFEIRDQQPTDKNFQLETFTLNYVNLLLPEAKRIATTPLVSSSQAALAGIADVPTKQKIVALTVSYQSSPLFEFSTGVMVPVRPFHSYIAAGGVVQENLTYTVVPIANTSIRLGRELVAMRQRVAFFGSIAVGYNPATSAVEFGVGPTFSWRSIQLSGMADVGRDTRLHGGAIGSAASATPPTEIYWAVKPAISLSVRLPLGGK